ncbi:MAG: NHL repeat-containing protein [Chloroflexi bacterium]|nr:NHL repeat-containing protein [Chloroflexota bacterium]MDA1226944.1 NHL repeat-containing protein [Chloroflexota bacterium]
MLTTTVAGRTWNYSHTIGRNAAAGNGFTQPTDVVVAPGGVLYVLSRGNDGAGGVVAPNKRIGKVTMDERFIGDFGREQLTFPCSLAVDKDGNVYCSDEFEKLIKVFDADGQLVSEWDGEGGLQSPSGIAFDADENLLVVETSTGQVKKFTKTGNFISAFGSNGTGPGQMDRPWGICVDSNGDIFVADWGNNRAQKFSPDGTHLLTFGQETGGPAAFLDHPADVAVDSEGDVYVSDWGEKLVKIFEADGTIITQLVGDAVEFSKWAKEVVEANPDAVKAYRRVKDKTKLGLFNRPVGIAIDENDNLIVADSTRGRLQVYSKEKDYMDPQFNL